MDKPAIILCLLSETQRNEYKEEFAALQRPGLQFIWRDDPEAVLETVGELTPALIVVGMEIGMMEGLEFLALLMQRYPKLDKPVVVLPNKGDPFSPVVQRRDPQTGRSSTEDVDFDHIVSLVDELATTVAPPPATGAASKEQPLVPNLGDEPQARGALLLADLFPAEPASDDAAHLFPEDAFPGANDVTPAPQPLPAPGHVHPQSEPLPQPQPQSRPASQPQPAPDRVQPQSAPASAVLAPSQDAAPLPTARDLLDSAPGRPSWTLPLVAVLGLGLVGGVLYLMLFNEPSPGQPADSAKAPVQNTSPSRPPPEQQARAGAMPANVPLADKPAEVPAAGPKTVTTEEEPTADPSASAQRQRASALLSEGPLPLSFAAGSAKPSIDNTRQLALLVAALRQSAARIELGGHASDEGKENYNENLSLRRAQAVRQVLIERGVTPGQLVARGYGSSRPQASNDNEVGRAQNRRVTLRRLP